MKMYVEKDRIVCLKHEKGDSSLFAAVCLQCRNVWQYMVSPGNEMSGAVTSVYFCESCDPVKMEHMERTNEIRNGKHLGLLPDWYMQLPLAIIIRMNVSDVAFAFLCNEKNVCEDKVLVLCKHCHHAWRYPMPMRTRELLGMPSCVSCFPFCERCDFGKMKKMMKVPNFEHLRYGLHLGQLPKNKELYLGTVFQK